VQREPLRHRVERRHIIGEREGAGQFEITAQFWPAPAPLDGLAQVAAGTTPEPRGMDPVPENLGRGARAGLRARCERKYLVESRRLLVGPARAQAGVVEFAVEALELAPRSLGALDRSPYFGASPSRA